jgi:hypothetical protein
MADTSLGLSIITGLMTGFFALGGVGISSWLTSRRDAAQEQREAKRRRADKFEELVAAIYDFDHWLDGNRLREVYDHKIPQSVSPFAKVQSVSAAYFPQFDQAIRELDAATSSYRSWMEIAPQINASGFEEAYNPYAEKRDALLDALKKFAQKEFQ